MARPFTTQEDQQLGRYRARGMTWDEIAELLERTEAEVRSRAEVITLPGRRVWAPDEVEYVQGNYRAMTAEQMALALRRSVASVRGYLTTSGLVKSPHRINHASLARFIREKHALGWSDAEISATWSAEHPDQPCSRKHLCDIRRDKLGLGDNTFSEHRRRRVAEKTLEQCRLAGVASLGQLRAKSYEQFAARNGWPGITRPRLVQILNLLYERGPHTRQAIAAAIGMAWTDRSHSPASRCSLKGNGPGGSYMAELMRLGLVVRIPRAVKGTGRGKSVNLYAIAPHVRRSAG